MINEKQKERRKEKNEIEQHTMFIQREGNETKRKENEE